MYFAILAVSLFKSLMFNMDIDISLTHSRMVCGPFASFLNRGPTSLSPPAASFCVQSHLEQHLNEAHETGYLILFAIHEQRVVISVLLSPLSRVSFCTLILVLLPVLIHNLNASLLLLHFPPNSNFHLVHL